MVHSRKTLRQGLAALSFAKILSCTLIFCKIDTINFNFLLQTTRQIQFAKQYLNQLKQVVHLFQFVSNKFDDFSPYEYHWNTFECFSSFDWIWTTSSDDHSSKRLHRNCFTAKSTFRFSAKYNSIYKELHFFEISCNYAFECFTFYFEGILLWNLMLIFNNLIVYWKISIKVSNHFAIYGCNTV